VSVFDDTLVRFLVEGSHVRGALVHLDSTWRTLLERRVYELGPRTLLGEAAAAAALLASTIRFGGSMIMQASGGSRLRLLVVEATGDESLRGLVRVREDAGEKAATGADSLLDAGRLVITIDPGEGRERYQGIVALDGQPLAQSLEAYFERSEQIATRLWLTADDRRARGLLLQQMPGGGGEADPDVWNRCVHLASTVTDRELLAISTHALLQRLFHEEPVRVFEPEHWRFHCGCSREKVRAVLRAMGRAELELILAEEGHISVDCEFCNAVYRFDQVDFGEVFEGPEVRLSVGTTRH
jgi:molecular chaperone Hsp33